MIKLIASDLDGSLLDDDKNLPENFKGHLDKLKDMGVTFVAASGRSYVTLKNSFSPYSDKLSYICDNGAYVVHNNEVVSIDTLPKESVFEVVKYCERIKNIKILLCGVHGTYHLSYDKEFNDKIKEYYINQVKMDSLYDVDDDIFKIAICDLSNPAYNSYPILNERFKDEFSLQVSGEWWMDVMNYGVNKGVALKKLRDLLKVSYEETMAFGDFYNDIELLSQAKYSFVMENANEDMKQYGNFLAKRNTENGVMAAIDKYVYKGEGV